MTVEIFSGNLDFQSFMFFKFTSLKMLVEYKTLEKGKLTEIMM